MKKNLLITLALTALCVTVSPLPSQANLLGDFGSELVNAIGQSAREAEAKKQQLEQWFQEGVQASKIKDYPTAVNYWSKAAEQGHAKSQYALGVCYSDGLGVKVDKQKALSLFQAAAKSGIASAQLDLGICYLNGIGTKQNDAEAFKWFNKAAKQKYSDAYPQLGYCYYRGIGTEVNLDKAVKYLLQAAENGDGTAQCILAQVYLDEQNPHSSPSEALKWLDKAAEAGNAEAKTMLAEQCLVNAQGQYTAEKGVKLLKETLKKDKETAPVYLSLCCLSGYGTTQDVETGVKLLTDPAKKGNSFALDLLQALAEAGIIDAQETLKTVSDVAKTAPSSDVLNNYRVMMAVCAQVSQDAIAPNEFVAKCLPANRKTSWPQDKEILTSEDVGQLITAAELGNDQAQTALGLLYASDKEINPLRSSSDKWESAYKWFNRAAQQNNITAQTHAGICLLEWKGTARDPEKAVALLRGSAAQGDALAKHHLGQCYAQGIGVKQDSQEAQKLLSQAASKGISGSKEALGNITKEQGLLYIPAAIYTDTKRYDNLKPYDAFVRGKQACEKGDPKGYALLESSARRGCNHAKLSLACALLPAGHKLRHNWPSFVFEGKQLSNADRMQRYLKWMVSAADNGSLEACQNLRKVYKGGFGVDKNSAKVFQYTKAAAQLKDSEAMYDLGTRYAQGIGCQKDRAAAVKWMKQAAHAGNEEAQQWIYDRSKHYYEGSSLVKISSEQAFREYSQKAPSHHRPISQSNRSDYSIFYGVVIDAHYVDGSYIVVVTDYKARGNALLSDDLYFETNPNWFAQGAVKIGDVVQGHGVYIDKVVDRPYRSKIQKGWQGPKIGGWEDLLK